MNWLSTGASLRLRHGDAVALVSGSQRARDVLGWQPKRSGMDQMIRDRPELTEGELLDLAIRHLYHSFEVSPDGMVDT